MASEMDIGGGLGFSVVVVHCCDPRTIGRRKLTWYKCVQFSAGKTPILDGTLLATSFDGYVLLHLP